VDVRGVFISIAILSLRKRVGDRLFCLLGEDCPVNHPMVIATYKIEGKEIGAEIENLLKIIRLGNYPRPLYIYLDSGGFQLLTGKATSSPEGAVNSALLLSNAIGDNGVIYMTLLDYPASRVDLPMDEFERRLDKALEYYSRQLDYYFKGGREQKNIRVMMPIHGGTPERVGFFMKKVAPLIRDYGLTGFSVTGITGVEARDSSWFNYTLSRISSLSRGVLEAGSRIIDLHFLAFFQKRLWLVGAFAQIPELRTVTADSMAFADYVRRYLMFLSSIPDPHFINVKEARILPCNCPICRAVREAGLEDMVVQGVKDYATFFLKLHNVYEYLRFSEVAFRYPRIGFEAMGIDYDSFMERVMMAVKGELGDKPRGLLGFVRK
jgi:hypothetical protein